ncbi:MAG: two-component sensor histidine kinase, partial [Actinomycetota bacterium]|nr:two-component sensor histidine kinase [Actinomycetota bacterium]
MLPEVLVPTDDRDVARAKRSRRDWIVDGTFFAFALLAGAVVLGNTARIDDMSDAFVVVDLAAGLVACGLLWVRRRRPVHVA